MEEKSLLGTVTDPVIPPTSDEKTMALLSHVLTLVAGFVAPLIIYLIKKDESPFITSHAKESLNFQITLFILIIILIIIVFIGWVLIPIAGIIALIFVVMASIKANEGKLYKYPFSIKFIK